MTEITDIGVSTRKRGLVILWLFILVRVAWSQQAPSPYGSEKLYERLENYSERGKFNAFIYGLLFNRSYSGNEAGDMGKNPIQPPSYAAYEGKVIRSIHVETLHPFGYSIDDTGMIKPKLLPRIGNGLHVKSRGITIRNMLLVRQNQRFDSLLVRESERLVRTRNYVHDVGFTVRAVAPDSVDIYIREIDSWSIIPDVMVSSTRQRFSLTDYNIMGMGHEWRNQMIWNSATNHYDFNTRYRVSNFRNTFITTTLVYGEDGYGEFTKGIAAERPFFSAYTKWAGGVSLMQQIRYESLAAVILPDALKFKVNVQDYWIGKASQILKGRSELSRTTQLITSARYYLIRYVEKPDGMEEAEDVFSDENLYLTSVGISTRTYVQDKYLFRYGVVEDIPVGKAFSVTTGLQFKNGDERSYLGARLAFGTYHDWGYLSSGTEFGTFFKKGNAQQGSLSIGVNYFTKIGTVGNYRFRQFVKTQAIFGFNRVATDVLTLNDGRGWGGFDSPTMMGTHRLLLTFQTQSYTPWNLIGFRFGPYLTYSCGMIGDDVDGFKRSRVYSQFGLGVLIKNENLVFDAFQLSISFFPFIPGVGHNVYQFNSYSNTDFGITDFEVGKPSVVSYR